MPTYYPMFIDIRGQKCLVVGGGSVAERKVRSLLSCGAKVTVLSTEVGPAIRQLSDEGAIEVLEKGYAPADSDGFFLVFAATNDRAVNEQVFADVEERSGLVNVVDDPKHCRFIVPSIVERGNLTLAISTAGKSPALAKRLREEIEAIFPEEYADYLEQVAELRRRLREKLVDTASREDAWRILMQGGLLQLLKEGRMSEAEERLEQVAKERT